MLWDHFWWLLRLPLPFKTRCWSSFCVYSTQNASCCKTDRLQHGNIRASHRLMWKLLHHTQLAPPTFALVEPKVSRHLYVLSNPLAMLLQVLSINFSIGTARTKRGGCLKSSDHWPHSETAWSVKWFLLPVATCTCSEITSGSFWDFLYQFKTYEYAAVRLFLCL